MKGNRLLKGSMLVALVAAISFTGCSKDDDKPSDQGGILGEVTFTVSGDGFSNQTITIQGVPDENHHAKEGSYYLKSKFTGLTVASDTLPDNFYKYDFDLNFNGNSTGIQHAGDKLSDSAFLPLRLVLFQMGLYRNGVRRSYYYNYGAWGTPTPGTINITKYEAAGGRIEGTFEGTLVCADDFPTEVPIIITNGHFWFKRGKDNPY